jgi:hypothetical protein
LVHFALAVCRLRVSGNSLDPVQRKTDQSQGKIERFTKLVSGSAVGIKAALWIKQVFYNRAHFFSNRSI